MMNAHMANHLIAFWTRRVNKLFGSVALLTVLVLVAGCDLTESDDSSAPDIQYGEWVPVGDGQARAWVRFNADDTPSALGVTMTEAALNGLPDGPAPTDYHMHLPQGVSVPPYTHLGLDWNPAGHPPPQVYTVPHFDLHFYMLSEGTRESIQGGPATTFPAEQYVPDGYVPDSMNVPQMGMHYLDLQAPEFNGAPFTHTFIYGFYQGETAFIEPMFTVNFLESQPDVTVPIRQPEAYQETGYYPMQYTIQYDGEEEAYVFTLADLTRREGA